MFSNDARNIAPGVFHNWQNDQILQKAEFLFLLAVPTMLAAVTAPLRICQKTWGKGTARNEGLRNDFTR
jgi:hypothetical protein